MKRKTLLVLLSLSLVFSMTSMVFAKDEETVKIDNFSDISDSIKDCIIMCNRSEYAFADGERCSFDKENYQIMPYKEYKIQMIPLRAISGLLKADLKWNSENNCIEIKSKKSNILLKLHSEFIEKDGNDGKLVNQIAVSDNTAYISLDDIQTVFDVTTYEDNNLIFIGKKLTLTETQLKRLTPSFGIYVKDGAAGEGTENSPVGSFDKALSILSKIRNENGIPNGGISVYFFGGNYKVTKTYNLSEKFSGAENSPVCFKGLPGENAQFMGSQKLPIDKFTKVTNEKILSKFNPNVKDNIYQLDLEKENIKDYVGAAPTEVNLCLNGIPQTLSRWPNSEFTKVKRVNAQAAGNDCGSFVYSGSRPENWSDISNVWVQGYWMYDWDDMQLPIKKLDKENNVIYLNKASRYGLSAGAKYFAYNILEEVDVPGEWYINSTTGILYYFMPPVSEDDELTILNLHIPMINITNAENINFYNMTFGDTYSQTIKLKNCTDVGLYGCTIKNTGSLFANTDAFSNSRYTIEAYDMKRFVVKDCDFYNLGNAGVYFTSGDRDTLTSGESRIENCSFTRVGLNNYSYNQAICAVGVGNYVGHNVIRDCPSIAIMFGGNFNKFEYNEFYDTCRYAGDTGAIYTGGEWTSGGNEISNNLFKNVHAYSVYLDDCASGITVKSNLMYNCSQIAHTHGGRSNIYDSNVGINVVNNIDTSGWFRGAECLDPYRPMMMSYNTLPVHSDIWKEKFPYIQELMADEPEKPKYNTVTHTLTYATPDFSADPPKFTTTKEVSTMGTYNNNIATREDPGFYDVKNGNYKIKNPESLFDGKFVPIDYDNVGLYYDTYRKKLCSISDFSVISPMNNTGAISTQLMWQPSIGASRYDVTLATDKELKNVVAKKTVDRNFAQFDEIEAGGKTYYWTVKAYGIGINNPNETKDISNGVMKFTSAMTENAEKEDLSEAINSAESEINAYSSGDKFGEVPQSAKDTFQKAIDVAKEINQRNSVSQNTVNEHTDKLYEQMQEYKGEVKNGDVDFKTFIKDKEKWVAEGNCAKCDGDKVTFEPTVSEVMNFDDVNMGNYNIFNFQMKTTYSRGWVGLMLRANEKFSPSWLSGGYLVVIKPEQIELQRAGDVGKMIKIVPNDNIFADGKTVNVRWGAVDQKDGVHLILEADGKIVFDEIDNDPGDFPNRRGYIGFYSPIGNKIELWGQK